MKIYSLNTKKIYDIDLRSSGENAMPCPECSQDRKKKTAKSFSFNAKINAGYCNHCEGRFVEHKPFEKVEYIKPVFDNTFIDLRTEWVKHFLSKRGISEKTLKKMRISEKSVWMPQSAKNEQVVCYPYFRSDNCVNIKYRGSNKTFKLESGAELCWYNYDALYNYKEIIIVEGEIDCLSFIEEGYENCISVPNGANVGKMEYFDNSVQDLDKIEKFIICTDNDEKGILLRDELVRRLGFEKCFIANLKQYKDSNEYLLHEGRGSLKELVITAKMPKIAGVNFADELYARLDVLFENGLQKGKVLGYKGLDELITWETKRFAIVTGTPSCFTKEQMIICKDGDKPISEINNGDFVLTYNHEKNINEYREVMLTHKFTERNDKLFKIKMKDGTIIKVTENHEFFNGTSYVKIKDLLLSLSNKKK